MVSVMKRVKGGRRLVALIVSDAEVVEFWRAHASELRASGRHGAAYCVESAVYRNSRRAFAAARELASLGAWS